MKKVVKAQLSNNQNVQEMKLLFHPIMTLACKK
ncbi:hypothetical protein BBR47_52110 [Brevibacillus brevis NBRC 100599]|uniref:Uncharacterized protein n=1 Tax=Brevibacillus brevis (strain 47 / JCM 6285 / NBRC 100599) TaxID=358681 RepID=C0Z6I9_BREBN|nr:hypothetical protein BBR47_52110 [Brevibacillus brevis NBRC 100599]